MATNSTIQIRIDNKIKREATKTLKEVGLDMSSGIKLFLTQVALRGGLPFQVRTVNGFTQEYEEKMLKEIDWTLKHGNGYASAKNMFDALGKK